jgi:hypothetical protein
LLTLHQSVRAIACALFFCAFFAGHVRAQESNSSYWQAEHARTGHGNVLERGAGRAAGGLVAEARRYLGRGKFTRLPGAWCRDALNVWLRAVGLHTDGSRLARDAVRLGARINRPEPGAIMVLRHHTGVVAAVRGDRVLVISGNHGGRVAESYYPIRSVIAFVRPT